MKKIHELQLKKVQPFSILHHVIVTAIVFLMHKKIQFQQVDPSRPAFQEVVLK